MRFRLIYLVIILVIDIGAISYCHSFFRWEHFLEKNSKYKDYIDLCFNISILSWLSGRILSWLFLKQKNYAKVSIILALFAHSIIGLIPFTILSAGKTVRGIGETYVFESGSWNAVMKIFSGDLNLGGKIWLQIMNDACDGWFLWILFTILSYGTLIFSFRQSRKS